MDSAQRLNGPLAQPPEGGYDISLRDILLPVWRRLWTVVLVAVAFVGAALGFSLTQTPLYEAKILVLVGQEENAAAVNLGPQITGLQQITVTMAEAVGTRPVAEATIQRLDLSIPPDEVLQNVHAEQVPATQFIEISYRDPDPRRAQRIANTIGDTFQEQVAAVSPSANAIRATVWERAEVPESPESPNLPLNVLVGLVVGLMVGTGLAFLLEHLDDSWHSPEEVEQVSGVPTFGVVPAFKVSGTR